VSSSSTFVAVSGDGYEQVMGRWSQRLAGPFLDFCGHRDGENVLDAGCGTGSLTFALAERMHGGSIEGVDLSAAYIGHATARNRDQRISFAQGDVCGLPHAAQSFDRVLSLLVLHFVPRPEQAVNELRRVARPGATVAAAVWDARGGFVANRIFYDTAAAIDEEGARRRAGNLTRPMTRPGELARTWHAAGLADIREAALTIRMEFSSFEDYWGPYVGKDGPGAEYVAALDDEKRDNLRRLVRAAYLDGEADGPRSYAAIAWAVAGRVEN
jgi:SAM-dependent methyltransferase